MAEDIVIEMSWTRAVPLLLEVYHNAETPKARHEAKDELMRCAAIADECVRLQAALKEPTAEMIEAGVTAADELELAMLERERSDHPEDLPDYDQGDICKAAFTAMVKPLLPPAEAKAD